MTYQGIIGQRKSVTEGRVKEPLKGSECINQLEIRPCVLIDLYPSATEGNHRGAEDIEDVWFRRTVNVV